LKNRKSKRKCFLRAPSKAAKKVKRVRAGSEAPRLAYLKKNLREESESNQWAWKWRRETICRLGCRTCLSRVEIDFPIAQVQDGNKLSASLLTE
jgi:hypothetical protein